MKVSLAPKHASFEIKYKLFKTYSMPLYGCVLWDHSSQCMEKLYVTWRKCVRKILNVPYNAHSVLLSIICNDLNIDCQLYTNEYLSPLQAQPSLIIFTTN